MLHTIKQTTLAICFQAVKLIFFFFFSYILTDGRGWGFLVSFEKLFIVQFTELYYVYPIFFFLFSIFSSLNSVFGFQPVCLLEVEAVTGISCSNVSPKCLHILIPLFMQFATVGYL